jgi:hypothetical protein
LGWVLAGCLLGVCSRPLRGRGVFAQVAALCTPHAPFSARRSVLTPLGTRAHA